MVKSTAVECKGTWSKEFLQTDWKAVQLVIVYLFLSKDLLSRTINRAKLTHNILHAFRRSG